MQRPHVNITIPTYNRASSIEKAVTAALSQTYDSFSVTIIDDASTDDTFDVLKPYFDLPQLCYVRLASHVGAAQAKNVSLLCSKYDAITFHGADDVPSEHKLLTQVRALCADGHVAEDILDWPSMGHESGCELEVDVVVGALKVSKMDGTVNTIDTRMSLVDDFFPNLQFASQTNGERILVDAGLFRRKVFEEVGGYLDSMEEDREIRNRTIACGYLYYYLKEPLLTKIETDEALTLYDETDRHPERLRQDREQIWYRVQVMRQATEREALKRQMCTMVDLSGLEIDFVSRPSLLTMNVSIPATEWSKAVISKALSMQVAA